MTHIFLKYLETIGPNIGKSLENLTKSDPNIVFKEHDDLVIFKYKNKYGSEIERSCRGLIMSKLSKKIVCYSNNGSISFESFIKCVPFDQCVIEENLEGTLINLYFNNNCWCVSTKFCINAENSKFRGNKSFRQYFDKLCNIDLQVLDPNFTYSFLLQIPDNRLVSNIDSHQLYHIETLNNITGEKILLDIGVQKPKILKLNDLNSLNLKSYRAVNRELVRLDWVKRGYMMFSKDRKHRCSLINPAYETVLNLIKNQTDIKYIILEGLYYKCNIEDILFYFPEYNNIKIQVSDDLDILVKSMLESYKEAYCFKNSEVSDIPKKYKKLLARVHSIYKHNHQNNILFRIDYSDIKATLLKQKCQYVYTILYKS